MVRRRRAVILMPVGRGGRDFTIVLTPGAFTIFVAFHPVDLLAISIQVACSGGHSRLRSDGSPSRNVYSTAAEAVLPCGCIDLAFRGFGFSLQCVYDRARFVCHLDQLRPGTVIIFARQFARGVESHV